MTSTSQYLVIFGGLANDGNTLGDTWIFDIDTMKWSQVTNSQGPSGSDIIPTK